jgi:hypothetical protein
VLHGLRTAAVVAASQLAALMAATNGSVVPNSGRVGSPVPGGDGHLVCKDEQGQDIACCQYQVGVCGRACSR